MEIEAPPACAEDIAKEQGAEQRDAPGPGEQTQAEQMQVEPPAQQAPSQQQQHMPSQ